MSYAIEINNHHQINSELSLYIPHVFPNFTTEYIANIFELIGLGRVDHIDLVAKQDKYGKNYNAAYVHFAEWFNCPATENFQERVINPNKEARIVHDDPWFWIVLENKAKKYEPGARKQTLDLSSKNPEDFVAEMHDEIDALIAECFNEPIDMSCEFEEYEVQTENTQLSYANEFHEKIAELRTKNNDLHNRIAELTLSLQANKLELDEARQNIFMLEGLVSEGLVVAEA